MGGIAAIIGEISLEERLATIRKSRHKRHYAPFIVAIGVFLALEFGLHWKTMTSTIAALAVCALVLAYLRRDLVLLMLVSATNFTVLYFALFLVVLAFYPEFVRRYYNLPNLLGVLVRGVPIEELLFAATGGAVWSVGYEYVYGYRLEKAGVI